MEHQQVSNIQTMKSEEGLESRCKEIFVENLPKSGGDIKVHSVKLKSLNMN